MATEQVQLGYSAKNIPLSNKWNYRQCLIKKTKAFLRNMNWAAIFFLNKSKSKSKETYGFKSTSEPQRLPQMKEFEEKMLDMVVNVEFREPKNSQDDFQRKLKRDLKNIKSDKNIYVKADKTSNYHKMSKENYNKYLSENIQKKL